MEHQKGVGTIEEELAEVTDADFGKYCVLLHNKLFMVQYKWDELRAIWSDDPEVQRLLDTTGRVFFQMIARTLWNDIVLTLSAMADPYEMGKFRNVSLDGLLHKLRAEHETFSTVDLTVDFRNACAKLQHLRNKAIAHYDVHTLIEGADNQTISAGKIAGVNVSVDEVDAAIRAAQNLLNQIRSNIGLPEMLFDSIYHNYPTFEMVLAYLRWGEERLEQMKSTR